MFVKSIKDINGFVDLLLLDTGSWHNDEMVNIRQYPSKPLAEFLLTIFTELAYDQQK